MTGGVGGDGLGQIAQNFQGFVNSITNDNETVARLGVAPALQYAVALAIGKLAGHIGRQLAIHQIGYFVTGPARCS